MNFRRYIVSVPKNHVAAPGYFIYSFIASINHFDSFQFSCNSYRNQLFDLRSKSNDWLLYEMQL